MRLHPLPFWLLARAPCSMAPQALPTIIIHFIDDLGYGDIGPVGAVKQKTHPSKAERGPIADCVDISTVANFR